MAQVIDTKGKRLREVETPPAFSGSVDGKANAIFRAVFRELSNPRAGTADTKKRDEVRGGGRKPWKQKGTGRARQGSIRSPQWAHGGVVFGPHPRDYSKKTNKAVKQLALRKALSSRVNAGEVYLIDPLVLDQPRTKDLVIKLKDGGHEARQSALFVVEAPDKNLHLASRNHPKLETVTGELVNAEQLLRYDRVLITDGAFSKISARLQK